MRPNADSTRGWMRMDARLRDLTFDPELSPGAYNAIHVCLRLEPHERITIITDVATLEIAACLANQVESTGAECSTFVLEEHASRPLKAMPQVILDDLPKSQVSIFAAQAQIGELGSRGQMTRVVSQHKLRHAHMVNISKRIMVEGMRADFLKVDQLSTRLLDKARKTRLIHAVTPGGTDIVAEFSPHVPWAKTSGIITAERWGNLPDGEIFTCPHTLDGVLVVDGVVGDYLSQEYGDLQSTPLVIQVSHSRIEHMRCSNPKLLQDFAAYVATDENSNRVGEFAIGTNLAVKTITGNILQDEKMPGIHIAFGHPQPPHAGLDWSSTTHIDCVGRQFDIWMDDEKIMEGGKFLIPV